MSPALQGLFVTQIAPILIDAVPRVVRPVGSEDAEKLVQDDLVTACEAVDRLERRNRAVLPRSVAYYAITRLKCGRRSMSAGRTDALSPGCQLDGNAAVLSLDAPLWGAGEDGCCETTLGDLLAGRRDDPATAAIRDVDWGDFLRLLDPAQQYIVSATAEGESLKAQAAALGVSSSFLRPRTAAARTTPERGT